MGLDFELFVHPERISNQLICPICTLVLERPVQTPSDHLFCEDELLEWLSRSDFCPVSQQRIDPSTIRKPSRIILNMLSELETYCPNRDQGCMWQGQHGTLETHVKTCNKKSRDALLADLAAQEESIQALRTELKSANRHIASLERRNTDLETKLEIYERKLKVYDAFFNDDSGLADRSGPSVIGSFHGSNETEGAATESALQRVARLRRLETFQVSANHK